MEGGWYRVDVIDNLAVLVLATLELNSREESQYHDTAEASNQIAWFK